MSETKFRSIDIDFDVFQLIVLENRGFEESDSDALRRLLSLSDSREESTTLPNQESRSWTGQGMELPEGTKLKMTYSDTKHGGTAAGKNGK